MNGAWEASCFPDQELGPVLLGWKVNFGKIWGFPFQVYLVLIKQKP